MPMHGTRAALGVVDLGLDLGLHGRDLVWLVADLHAPGEVVHERVQRQHRQDGLDRLAGGQVLHAQELAR